MRYSSSFERDFEFYLRIRNKFNFSGDVLRLKNGQPMEIITHQKGLDGKCAFFTYDSTGKLLPTKHPNVLFKLLKAKASANFHIKELYAKDRAAGRLSRNELEEIYQEIQPPLWFKDSVEKFYIQFL